MNHTVVRIHPCKESCLLLEAKTCIITKPLLQFNVNILLVPGGSCHLKNTLYLRCTCLFVLNGGLVVM